MDPVTQVALGAAAGLAVCRPEHARRAALAGGLGGLLPDADVLIRSSEDPLLFLEYHRHFTHSLLFVPIGGFLAAAVAWLLARGRWAYGSLLLPAAVGWATHGPLDACTSYGTHLLWPLDGGRVSWNVISIVDPVFTGLLLVGVWRACRRARPGPARRWLLAALAYLLICSLQLARARAAYEDAIEARGHTPSSFEVRPSIGNCVLYRAFYREGGRYVVDAVRVPWFGTGAVREGGSHPALETESFVRRYELDEVQREDLERFRFFSDGFLIEDTRFPGVVSDFRYAAVPDSVAPLWGVDFEGLAPGQHAAYRTFNRVDPSQRSRFLDLLLDRDPSGR